jgi:hypothetical protein
MSLSSSRKTEASHADWTHGGGALTRTTATRTNLGARAPLGAAAAIIEAQANHSAVSGLSWIIPAAEG